MNDKNEKALKIAIAALTLIATRQGYRHFQLPALATEALKQISAIREDKDESYTIDTDATEVTPEYNVAKEFVETFVKDEKDCEILLTSEYEDDKGSMRVLYELYIPHKTATAEMVDWLDDHTTHFTSDMKGIHFYFEIFAVVGTETAYLIKE